eukprot:7599501-Alexandrium_andersonii.AAC.1
MDTQEVARRVSAAIVTKLYQAQLERGAHFLHGQSASAASCQEPCMVELLGRPEVDSGIGHMCRFGMRVPWPAS